MDINTGEAAGKESTQMSSGRNYWVGELAEGESAVSRH